MFEHNLSSLPVSDINSMLIDYKSQHNPLVRLLLGTNFFGDQVHPVSKRIPDAIAVRNKLKTSRVNVFKPFKVAPVNTRFNRFSDYSCWCRIMESCGLGITPSGFYMFAFKKSERY